MGCFQSKRDEETENSYDMTPIKKLPVIFVNGVPGAGNHTVAETIANMTGFALIRPGELIRSEAAKDTVRGRLVAQKMPQDDVPEQLIIDLIKEAMLENQKAGGYILVGFPRNQRMSLLFQRQIKLPEKVVALKVDNEVAVGRLQSKFKEVGKPDIAIDAVRQLVKDAADDVSIIQKRFGATQKVTIDSSNNVNAIASTLEELLSDTVKKEKSKQSCSTKEPIPSIVPSESETPV